MEENKKRISQIVREKTSDFVGRKDDVWVWNAYFKKHKLKNRFNVLIGIVFVGIATLFLYLGTIPFVFGSAVIGLIGIKRLFDYDFSIEVSVMDEIINRFEKF